MTAILSAITDGFAWLADTLVNFVFAQVTIAGTEIELIVIWLALPMVLFTLYFGFINVRYLPLAFSVVRGRYWDETAPGEVSQFKALSTALSGTVGLGNIAGVAIAIALGGPGAAFWMVVIAFFAMSLKFTECTAAVKYRIVHEDGTVSGGPMHYLYLGLSARGWPRLGRVLATLYAVLAIPSLLQFGQVNQSYSQLSNVTGLDAPWLYGLGLAALTGAVIIGGIRSIAAVTSRLVPFMCGLYLITALIILTTFAADIPGALVTIVTSAFSADSVAGGVIGAFVVGMRRAVYSTEAGLGSATIAHAAAKTREPASEGLVALYEPFIDTIVVNTMTALVIVVTGAYLIESANDIQMTSAAFGSVISWFPYVLAVSVFLFAFSTIISWGYYIGKVWEFLFGESRTSSTTFKIVFCLMIVPGAAVPIQQVIDIIDSFFFLMAVPNVLGLYFLLPDIRRELNGYLGRVRSGAVHPTA